MTPQLDGRFERRFWLVRSPLGDEKREENKAKHSAIFSDTCPSSLFCSLRFCSAPPINQFAGSGNIAILRKIAAKGIRVSCPSASISQ
jgi:hypothetical protein